MKETFHLHHLKDLLRIDVKPKQGFEFRANHKQEIGCRTCLPHGAIAVQSEGGTLRLH
jgi:hypothetical protein